MDPRGCRTHVPGAAVLAALLAAGVSLAQDPSSSTLDSLEMKRLLYDLEADSNRLVDDVRDFLKRSWRWEPVGVDRQMWDAVQGFEDAADRVEGRFLHEPYPGMDREVREMLERGREVGALLRLAGSDRDLSDGWSRIRGALQRLARSYGWDYDAGRFQAPLPTPRFEDPGGATGLGDPWDRDPSWDRTGGFGSPRDRVAPRTTRGDDLAVRGALGEIDRLIRELRSRLRYRPIERPEDILQGLAEGLLRDVQRNAGIQTPQEALRMRLEADLTALETGVADALRRFAVSQRAADVRPEARSVLRLGRNVDDDLRRSPPPSDIASTWSALRDQLNRLAVLYDFEPIPAE